jgi:orotidine-5'-phosphate decarboxylase
LGAVVGATYPKILEKIRNYLPRSFLLIPGYGAQGAGPKDVQKGFDNQGLGAIINSSRGIMFAYNKNPKYEEDKFTLAAKDEVQKMNKEINKYSPI